MSRSGTLVMPDGTAIAWIEDGPPPPAQGPVPCGFFWLGGFRSDMSGTKAATLGHLAEKTRRSAVRFDYSGHGESGGRFEDGTLSRWLDEAEAVFREVAAGPRIVIGSSMGGWLALLLYRRLKETAPAEAARIRGLVLLAPATDMTQDLMWNRFSASTRKELEEKGRVHIPSDYSPEPYLITRALVEDGRQHLLLAQGLDVSVPVRILQGDRDTDVPWQHAMKTFEALRGEDVAFTLIKGADHRLSGPRELQLLQEVVLALAARADGGTPNTATNA